MQLPPLFSWLFVPPAELFWALPCATASGFVCDVSTSVLC